MTEPDDALYSKLYAEGYPPGPTGMLWGFLKARGMPKAESAIFDAGCGPGVMLRRFETDGYYADGVDISSYAVEQARKAGLHATQGTITELFWLSNTFDLVWCCDTLEHLRRDEVDAALSELSRIAPRLVASVCMRKSGWKGMADLHHTVEGAEWWLGRFNEHFSTVVSEQQAKYWLLVEAKRTR